jgi:hypothetical protein
VLTQGTLLVCVDAKSALNAKHTASWTKLASHAQRAKDVPVNFSWKLTKDKAVRYQNLELAGWYQTVPYLRLRSQMRWHIAIESYLPTNYNHSGNCKGEKNNTAEWMTWAWRRSVFVWTRIHVHEVMTDPHED